MPGKVNPVIPEAVNAAAFRVFGLDTAVTFAAEAGQLQLSAFEPVILSSIHESVQLLGNAITLLIDKCLIDLEANAEACQANLEAGTALATYLVPTIGRSEEHTSELQSLMRNSNAVFCLKKN